MNTRPRSMWRVAVSTEILTDTSIDAGSTVAFWKSPGGNRRTGTVNEESLPSTLIGSV